MSGCFLALAFTHAHEACAHARVAREAATVNGVAKGFG